MHLVLSQRHCSHPPLAAGGQHVRGSAEPASQPARCSRSAHMSRRPLYGAGWRRPQRLSGCQPGPSAACAAVLWASQTPRASWRDRNARPPAGEGEGSALSAGRTCCMHQFAATRHCTSTAAQQPRLLWRRIPLLSSQRQQLLGLGQIAVGANRQQQLDLPMWLISRRRLRLCSSSARRLWAGWARRLAGGRWHAACATAGSPC